MVVEWNDDNIRPPDRSRSGALIASEDDDDDMARAIRESRRVFKRQQQKRRRIIEVFRASWEKNGCAALAPRLSVYKRFPVGDADAWIELFEVYQELLDAASGHIDVPEYDDHGGRLGELLLTRRQMLKEKWLEPLRLFLREWRDAVMEL